MDPPPKKKSWPLEIVSFEVPEPTAKAESRIKILYQNENGGILGMEGP